MQIEELMSAARAAAEKSYSPYSGFRVGAALLCSDGTLVTGTNVENRSYGGTICAERSAAVTAVSSGRRSFSAIAVSCPDAAEAIPPCGICRQFLSEFAGPETPVYYAGMHGAIEQTTLGELLPRDSLHDLANRTS